MATGDIRNNLRRLQKQVSLIRYPDELDYEGLTNGNVSAHLPILYYAFFDFSQRVVENISKMNYCLAGKKDAAFMNVVFKIIREKHPKLSLNLKVSQFMSKGFAERKIILTTDILDFVRTSPQFGAGKAHSRSRSAATMACLVGNDSSAVQVSDISGIKLNLANVSKIEKQKPSTVAPQMQSTSRSTFQNGTLPHSSNSFSSTIRVGIEDLHAMGKNDLVLTRSMTAETPESLDTSGPKQCHLQENISELRRALLAIQLRQDCIESENKKLRHDLGVVQEEHMKLKKELEGLSVQQPLADLTNIAARLDIMESKLLVIENSTKLASTESHSPVCGYNLCSQLNKLQLQHNTSDLTQMNFESCEKSLMDVTNDSPITDSKHQRMKLLDLVQGTRTLLGMSDVSDFQAMGNKEISAENKPPK